MEHARLPDKLGPIGKQIDDPDGRIHGKSVTGLLESVDEMTPLHAVQTVNDRKVGKRWLSHRMNNQVSLINNGIQRFTT